MSKDTTKVIPKAVYKSFNSHDCEAYYKCPLCNKTFGSWSLPAGYDSKDKGTASCPCCGTELRFR